MELLKKNSLKWYHHVFHEFVGFNTVFFVTSGLLFHVTCIFKFTSQHGFAFRIHFSKTGSVFSFFIYFMFGSLNWMVLFFKMVLISDISVLNAARIHMQISRTLKRCKTYFLNILKIIPSWKNPLSRRQWTWENFWIWKSQFVFLWLNDNCSLLKWDTLNLGAR